MYRQFQNKAWPLLVIKVDNSLYRNVILVTTHVSPYVFLQPWESQESRLGQLLGDQAIIKMVIENVVWIPNSKWKNGRNLEL